MPADLPLRFVVSASLGFLGAFLAWAFALYIAVVSPVTKQSRFLIALLIVDGFAISTGSISGGVLVQVFGFDPFLVGRIHQASDWLVVGLYLSFIGMTVQSKFVAPLKSSVVHAAIVVVSVIVAVSIFLLPNEVREAFNQPFYVVVVLSLSWGFVAAIHSWISAGNETQRVKARAFTLAFGVRDFLWAAVFLTNVLGMTGPIRASMSLFYPLAVVWFVPLIAYGVLRAQLFDVDLRIKKTLRRSLLAATFVAAFFLISELAGLYLSGRLGNIFGLVGTAALIFLLNPIQRAAERVADAAMPNTRATPQYEAYRKLQVYEAAVQAALDEGDISGRERRMLDALVESLGIDQQAAVQVETDLRAAGAAA